MKTRTLAALLAMLLVAAAVQYVSRTRVDRLRQPVGLNFKAPQLMLSPDIAQVVAGEFNGLLADYILLEIGSFVGSDTKTTKSDYQSIYHAMKLALVLDPYFQQTYLLVQGILPWRAHMIDESLELLNISRAHRPWDWRPGQYLGFNYYYFKNDYAKASEVFLETAQIKGAPVLLAVLGARLAMKGQQTAAAIAMLKHMLKNSEMADADRLEVEQRLNALTGVLVIEKALAQYQAATGRYPAELETLVRRGIIQSIPSNPYADRFYYDPERGRVFFDQTQIKTQKSQ